MSKQVNLSCLKHILLFITFGFVLAVNSSAQNIQIQSLSAVAENIYIQLDSKAYTTDQIIWMKATVTEAAYHIPSTISGVLYVELIGPDEKIKDEKIIKLSQGVGDNFFELNKTYVEGKYLIRAYTKWNVNFGNSFVFEEYINIFPSSPGENHSPISKVFLTEKSPGEFWLSANFIPTIIDSLHQKKLNVFLKADDVKDTLTLKANNDNQYLLEYPIDAHSSLATLGMVTQNGRRFTKTFSLDKENIGLQFFPEGGNLVHGTMGKVGFKALNARGQGIQVQGNIIDDKDELITDFKSNHLGMGTLFLVADSSKNYYASIRSPVDSTLHFRYPLPKAKPNGQTLSIMKSGAKIRIVSTHSNPVNDSTFVQINCRGMGYYFVKGRLNHGEMMISFPTNNLPEGVLSFTLMDKKRWPIAERLYFNERPEGRLKLQVQTDKSDYQQREKTELSITALNSKNTAEPVNLSVLVINQDLMGQTQQSRQNILSQLLLSADLRGHIESPGYYFNTDNKNRLKDLDALMLTQGWRRYNYSLPIDTITYQPEVSLNVSGTVGGIFSSKKKKEGVELTLMTFGERASFQGQSTDSLGRFYFSLPEAFGQKLNILIQSANKSGKNRNYSITLDKKPYPPLQFDQQKAVEELDSLQYALIEKQQEKSQINDAFKLSTDIMELEEITVEDYLLTPQREKVMNRFGKPDRVIDGQEIQEKEEKWSYGLYSVLLANYPKDIRIERVEDQSLTSSFERSNDSEGGDAGNLNGLFSPIGSYLKATIVGGGETLILVDAIPVQNYNYDLIPNLPPSEVKSVELIRFAKDFSNLYREVYPLADPMSIPATGNVIAIYTHAGKGIFNVKKADGILKAAIPIYSPSREFYTPKYEQLTAQDWIKPDLRTLVHWQPQINTDENGKADINFYNGDITGNVMVIIEAISSNGNIGYKELVYKVEEKKRPLSTK